MQAAVAWRNGRAWNFECGTNTDHNHTVHVVTASVSCQENDKHGWGANNSGYLCKLCVHWSLHKQTEPRSGLSACKTDLSDTIVLRFDISVRRFEASDVFRRVLGDIYVISFNPKKREGGRGRDMAVEERQKKKELETNERQVKEGSKDMEVCVPNGQNFLWIFNGNYTSLIN